jgi:hypothetical protein
MIMKKIIALSVLMALAAIIPFGLFAADPIGTASETGVVEAEMISGFSVTKGASLDFGKLIPTTTSGTVVINATGTTATETNVVKAAGYTFSAATFTITSVSTGVDWTVSPILNQQMSHSTNPAKTMNVTDFVISSTSGNTATANSFSVGATLNVGANQEIGKYRGSFPVTVTFN